MANQPTLRRNRESADCLRERRFATFWFLGTGLFLVLVFVAEECAGIFDVEHINHPMCVLAVLMAVSIFFSVLPVEIGRGNSFPLTFLQSHVLFDEINLHTVCFYLPKTSYHRFVARL